MRIIPLTQRLFRERFIKVRMDARLNIRELASLIGVTPDTVINWELRGTQPIWKKLFNSCQKRKPPVPHYIDVIKRSFFSIRKGPAALALVAL